MIGLNSNLTIPHNFTPRGYQIPVFNSIADGYNRVVAVWHRRAGKDKVAINLAVKESQKRVGNYYHFLPSYSQGRKIIWDGKDRSGFPFLGHIPDEIRTNTNNTEMKITLHNGSIYQVVGSDNINSIVGTNPVGCIFSEYSLQDPRGWDYVRPILRENGGWAVFIYTPRGKNHGYELYQIAQDNPRMLLSFLDVNTTGVITPEMIDEDRAEGMTEELIDQEYFLSFESAMPGAYYAAQIREARDEGRIGTVEVQDSPVYTYWDVGIDDSMTIWLVQHVGAQICCVAYYEESGEGLAHYVQWLRTWQREHNNVPLGMVTLPHDGKNRSPQTGESCQDFLQHEGFSVRIAPRPRTKPDGIESVRQMFSCCWFDDTNCRRGIDALSQYRKEFDEMSGLWKPVHDWTSHGSDAFQTMALVMPKLAKKGTLAGLDESKLLGKTA